MRPILQDFHCHLHHNNLQKPQGWILIQRSGVAEGYRMSSFTLSTPLTSHKILNFKHPVSSKVTTTTTTKTTTTTTTTTTTSENVNMMTHNHYIFGKEKNQIWDSNMRYFSHLKWNTVLLFNDINFSITTLCYEKRHIPTILSTNF